MKKIINNLLVKKTDNLFLQLFRYTFVGGLCFLIDFSIYLFLINIFSINYLLAGAIAFLIAVLSNYLLSIKWVFNQYKINNIAIEFNLFILISFIGLIFTEILLYLFIDLLLIDYIISKIIASFIVLFWNFTARRLMFYGKII